MVTCCVVADGADVIVAGCLVVVVAVLLMMSGCM